MKTEQEIKEWLLKNAVDDTGDLCLIGLDFSDFDGDIYINHMKVKRNLFQDFQIVKRNLYQSGQEVDKNLYQSRQKVGESFFNHKLENNEYWEEYEDYVMRRKKKLQKITKQQLAEMGYELTDEK